MLYLYEISAELQPRITQFFQLTKQKRFNIYHNEDYYHNSKHTRNAMLSLANKATQRKKARKPLCHKCRTIQVPQSANTACTVAMC